MYRIEYLSAADRDIRKLDPAIRNRILLDIEKLAKDPRPHGFVKLSGSEDIFRVKAGPRKNYRVLYQIQDKALIVIVIKVADRKDVYKTCDALHSARAMLLRWTGLFASAVTVSRVRLTTSMLPVYVCRIWSC